MALPNFFIIGAPKTGTTSLHFYLDQHPEVQMSAVKEPNFFSGPDNGIPYMMGRVSDLAEYEALFDGAMPVRGEASVGYANHPRRSGVPGRIRQLVPGARFVYVVRDPIARAISQHRHRVAWEGERRTLNQALGDLSDPLSPYLGPSRYMTQIELYLRHFSSDRLLVVDQTELLMDRRRALDRIFGFLEVRRDVQSLSFDEELNTESEHRSFPSFYARLVGPASPPLARLLPRRVRVPLRKSLERTVFSPLLQESLEPSVRERLVNLFGGEVARLRDFTGEQFASWSI